jgi:hypothetical protein
MIPAENDHYRGAFAAFGRFITIFPQRVLPRGIFSRSAGVTKRGYPSLRMTTLRFNLESKTLKPKLSGIAG